MNSLSDHILFIESGSQLLRKKGDEKVPVLTAANIDKNGQFIDGIFKQADQKVSRRITNQVLNANDVIMIKDGSDCGRCLLLDEEVIRTFKYISEHLVVIRPGDRIHPKYLWLKLNHLSIREYLGGIANGSSTPFITVDQLMSIPLKVPSLKAQQKLVKASELIKEMLQIDDKVEAVFRRIEIRLFEDSFGDLASLDKPTRLEQLSVFIKDGSRQRVNVSESGFPILSSKDIIPFALKLDQTKKVSEEDFEAFAERVLPERGDVLIALSGNNRGHAALIDSTVQLSVRNVAVIRLQRKLISASFLVHYINHPFIQTQLKETYSRGSGIKYISVSKLKSLQITTPCNDALDSWAEKSYLLEGFRHSISKTNQKVRLITHSLL